MKLITSIIETLWGVSLPVEHLAPLLSHCGQACVEMLLRIGR